MLIPHSRQEENDQKTSTRCTFSDTGPEHMNSQSRVSSSSRGSASDVLSKTNSVGILQNSYSRLHILTLSGSVDHPLPVQANI